MTGLKCIVKKRETGHTEMYPCFSACSYSVQLSDLAGQSPSAVRTEVGAVWPYRVCLKLGQQLDSPQIISAEKKYRTFSQERGNCGL